MKKIDGHGEAIHCFLMDHLIVFTTMMISITWGSHLILYFACNVNLGNEKLLFSKLFPWDFDPNFSHSACLNSIQFLVFYSDWLKSEKSRCRWNYDLMEKVLSKQNPFSGLTMNVTMFGMKYNKFRYFYDYVADQVLWRHMKIKCQHFKYPNLGKMKANEQLSNFIMSTSYFWPCHLSM